MESMVVFRILLFSIIAVLVLYVPFYYFAPFYHSLYVKVPLNEVNQWAQWAFSGKHGGIQIYIALILMFLAIGLTALFEYIYVRFLSIRVRWLVLSICMIDSFFYLRSVGFYPPMAAIRVNGQGIFFIAIAVIIAFIFGRLFDL